MCTLRHAPGGGGPHGHRGSDTGASAVAAERVVDGAQRRVGGRWQRRCTARRRHHGADAWPAASRRVSRLHRLVRHVLRVIRRSWQRRAVGVVVIAHASVATRPHRAYHGVLRRPPRRWRGAGACGRCRGGSTARPAAGPSLGGHQGGVVHGRRRRRRRGLDNVRGRRDACSGDGRARVVVVHHGVASG